MSEMNNAVPGPAEQQAVRVDYRLVVQHMERRYMAQISAMIQENAQLTALQEVLMAERDEARSELEAYRQQAMTKLVRSRPIKDNPQE